MTQQLQLPDLIERSLDYECGLISTISEIPTSSDEPDVQIYFAELQDPIALIPNRSRPTVEKPQGSGAGLSREDAMWCTIGEAIERYSARLYFKEDITYATADEVEGGRAFLEKVILFSDEEYEKEDTPFNKPEADLVRGWVKAKDLLSHEEIHVPAALTYMGYEANARHEILDKVYSTGLASHTSHERAILSGLYEVIERDAYSSYWLTKTLPLGISQAEVEAHLPPAFLESCNRVGFDFKVAALKTDIGVPVFITFAEVPGGGIASGAACGINVSDAITKSVVECCHTYNWCLEMKRSKEHRSSEHEVLSFKDHVAWYLEPDRSDAYPWHPSKIETTHSIPTEWIIGEVEDELTYVLSKIDKAGFRSYFVDLTPQDIKELGFVVTRTFVPGMQPLSAGYGAAHSDTRRLERFKPGVSKTLNAHTLNNPPHVFP